MGYLVLGNLGSDRKIEKDTIACPHCQAVIDKHRWRQDGGIMMCSACKAPLCHNCSSIYSKNPVTEEVQVCDTWEKKIDRWVADANRKAVEGGWA